jgi:DNA-binding XRE family transcriptional regulator
MSKENIINTTCLKYKLTKKELADKIGASASTLVNSAAENGVVSSKTKVAIELFIENQELKEQVQDFNIIKQVFSKFTYKS